jgi:transcriptional regulator with XRE-family HTH domain
MTQADMATELGMTPNYYAVMERGDRDQSKNLLLNVCDLYAINYAWLLRGEGEQNLSQNERVIRMQREAAGYTEGRADGAAVRESRPGWRGRLDTILDEQQETIEKSHRELSVPYEAILGGLGRRLDREEAANENQA